MSKGFPRSLKKTLEDIETNKAATTNLEATTTNLEATTTNLDLQVNPPKINLHNPNVVVDGKRMNCLGVVADAATLSMTGYIDVSNNSKPYVFFWHNDPPEGLSMSYVAQFDKDFVCLGTSDVEHRYVMNITKKPTCKYIVCSFPTEDKSTFQVTYGASDHKNVYNNYVNTKGGLEGQILLSYGDSQTEQNKWQPSVCRALGMINVPYGHGGYPVATADSAQAGFALSSDYMLTQLTAQITKYQPKIVTIMGGTNDMTYDGSNAAYNNILIGTDGTDNNTTFKGSLTRIVKTILNASPKTIPVIMSNIGGQLNAILDGPKTNANNYTNATFAAAARDVANNLGVPFIDVYNCGITIYNSATHLADGTHINTTTGAALVAAKVVNGLKLIEPIF